MERLKNLFEFNILLEVFFEIILMDICYGDDNEIYDDLSVCCDSYVDFPLKKYKEIIYFKNK